MASIQLGRAGGGGRRVAILALLPGDADDAYSYRIFDLIGDVDLAAWERVRPECAPSIHDPRFIAAAGPA
jgi:hypothetical protein